jgi:diphthamide synthase (EF-2-diphthine--ammonia ligase)
MGSALMAWQAAAIGLPFQAIPVNMAESDSTNANLLAAITAFLRTPEAAPYEVVVWSDHFWEEACAQHEAASAAAGKRGAYPLWEVGHDTAALARAIVADGLQAIVTSVDT